MKEQPKKDFKLKEIDIKPMIVSVQVLATADEEVHYLNCLLQSGSKANLKPELLMEAFQAFSGYDIHRIKINREEVYSDREGNLIDLLEASKASH